MESVINSQRQCFLCGTTRDLHAHHIFPGNPRRKHSEERGFKVYLCAYHHRKIHQHINSGESLKLKQFCQAYYESNYGTREDFIREFGKSRLED